MLWEVKKIPVQSKRIEWRMKMNILGATCEQRNVPPPHIFQHKQPSGSKPVCIIVNLHVWLYISQRSLAWTLYSYFRSNKNLSVKLYEISGP